MQDEEACEERRLAINEKFEYQGYWWIPGAEENRVPGTLSFDPDEGATLDLMSSPKGLEGIVDPLEPEVILGLPSDGKPITLKGCGRTLRSFGFGAEFSTFAADEVFVGEHFERPGDVGFESPIVEYLHVGAWADASGFKISFNYSGSHSD